MEWGETAESTTAHVGLTLGLRREASAGSPAQFQDLCRRSTPSIISPWHRHRPITKRQTWPLRWFLLRPWSQL